MFAASLLPLVACASVQPVLEANGVLRVVPESYISKAWTVYMDGDEEMRVTFWRPDVFRIEKGLKVTGTNQVVKTEISATGQYVTTTNDAYAVAYEDPLNDPNGAEIVLPEVKEDASRVVFADGADDYTWRTTAVRLVLDKRRGTFSCSLASGESVWSEARFDAFYFVGRSFNQVIDRYTEFTGRPNFIPIWGLELGDADAWMTRDAKTREPKQNDRLEYEETTPDVVHRNAEKYRADDMPGGWMLVNDGYGCMYMQLAWVVDALKGLGFTTGLWTEGALDRIKWEIGTAGTRVQKIDVAWSAPAYQHGRRCRRCSSRR